MNTSSYRELLLGCGNSREKRIIPGERDRLAVSEWQNLTTLDIDPACEPDIVFDLCSLEYQSLIHRPLKFLVPYPVCNDSAALELALHAMHAENCAIIQYNNECIMPADSFDEIHAYEVLEHCGEQGHFKLFFAQFREFWRVLKPGGYFCATVPDWRSVWAWGDPSHTRVINEGTLVFLSQEQYRTQVGNTAMSDFRALLSPADFEIVGARTRGEQFEFVLRAIK